MGLALLDSAEPGAYEPSQFRRVKVKVKLDGAMARTRKGYIFDRRRGF